MCQFVAGGRVGFVVVGDGLFEIALETAKNEEQLETAGQFKHHVIRDEHLMTYQSTNQRQRQAARCGPLS